MTLAAQQLAARVRAERSIGFASRRRRVPRARFPRLIESDYAGRLAALVQRMRAMTEQALPTLFAELPGGWRADESPVARARTRARRLRGEVEASVDDRGVAGIAADVGRRTADHHRGELQRQARAALGVEVMTLDPSVPGVIEGFVAENVSLISKLRGRVMDEIEAIVVRAYSDGSRAETIAPEIAARYEITERHARLVARDQIGKLNSRVTAARHQELGIASFEWMSMSDGRVRRRHVELHGRRYRYDKPPAEGLPGQPVCCRCVQQPVFDDLLALVS